MGGGGAQPSWLPRSNGTGGGNPQTISKYLSFTYLQISKKNWHPIGQAVQKIDFWRSFWGGWHLQTTVCQNISLLNIY